MHRQGLGSQREVSEARHRPCDAASVPIPQRRDETRLCFTVFHPSERPGLVRSRFRPSLQSSRLNMHFYARSSHPSAKTISLRGELYHCGCNSHLYGPKDASYGRNCFFIKMELRGGRNTTVSVSVSVSGGLSSRLPPAWASCVEHWGSPGPRQA